MQRALIITLLLATSPLLAQPAATIQRTPLATHQLSPDKTVARAEVVRLDFKPGIVTPPHLHPMPVISYVEQGSFLVEIEGQPAHRYTKGQSIYEPANAHVLHYDNVSKTEPAIAIATYLAGDGDKELIRMLPN
jgi:quercetin dioxygenase-like cupin family protein